MDTADDLYEIQVPVRQSSYRLRHITRKPQLDEHCTPTWNPSGTVLLLYSFWWWSQQRRRAIWNERTWHFRKFAIDSKRRRWHSTFWQRESISDRIQWRNK
jgi:hypothetical protein